MLTQGPEGPAPVSDIVGTVYTDGGGTRLYVEPLPPQSLTCLGPVQVGAVGCSVDRVWYGFANITPQQQADAEWLYRSPDLDRNWVLVVGHLAAVTVRDHRTGADPIEQTWFMVNKLYLTPSRGRVIELHAKQYFYATGATSNARSSRSATASSHPALRTKPGPAWPRTGAAAAPAASKTFS